MTFDQIVDMVADQLNLTTPEAVTRIGTKVNQRYSRVLRALGAIEFKRVTSTYAVVTGTRLQTITGIEKVLSVTVDDGNNRPPLQEVAYAEMQRTIPSTGIPFSYAVKRLGAHEVTLQFDTSFEDALDLTIEGEERTSTLSGAQEPAFSESFHDILYYGAMADELRKKEKIALARDAEVEFDRILAEMRLHVAVSTSRDIVQGKYNADSRWCGFPNRSVSVISGGGGGGSTTAVDYDPIIYVDDPTYGAAGDGIHDDTAAFEAAIAALPVTGGTIAFDSSKLYLLNIVINRPKVRIQGYGIGKPSSSTNPAGLSAFDVTQPVIELSNDTQLNEGLALENVEFNGLGTNYYGLRMSGGAYSGSFSNISIQGFTKKCLWIRSGSTSGRPAAYLMFNNVFIQPTSSAALEQCLLVEQTNTNSFVEAIFFNNLRISGVPFGKVYKNAGSQSTTFSNSYFQCGGTGNGVQLTKPFAVTPFLNGLGLWVDSDNSNDTLGSQDFATAGNPAEDFIVGFVSFDGKFDSNGTLLTGVNSSPMHLPNNTLAVQPRLYQSVYFVDHDDTNDTGQRIYGETTAGRMNVEAPNEVNTLSGIGVHQNYAAALASAIYRMVNSAGTHDVYATGLNLFIKPAATGYAQLETDTIKFGLSPLTLVIDQANGIFKFAGSLSTDNNQGIKSKNSGGTQRAILFMDGSDNVFVGQADDGTKTTVLGKTNIKFTIGGNTRLDIQTDRMNPVTDNQLQLGEATLAYKDIFSVNPLTVTSDERLKQDIEPISDVVLDAWSEVEFVQYHWREGDAQIHAGVIAQRVRDAFARHGLDARDYGVLVYDEDKDRYSIRYGEAATLEAALQRRTTQRLEARLAALGV